MAFRLLPSRKRDRGRPTQQAVAEPPQEGTVRPAPQVFTGTTIEPEEGAASRIDSAADVDPNVKRYGMVGGPGGAGGFGGAGTK
jgi:hypothetical protein